MSKHSEIIEKQYLRVRNCIDTHILIKSSDYSLIKSPLFVGWELTSNCNLRCCHCRAADNDSRIQERELNTDECKKVVDKLYEAEVYTLGITGGEPFVRNDIMEIISYCKKKNLQLIIYTNGTLITKEIAKKLGAVLDKYDIVHVSLDSSIDKVHNQIRGKECFYKVIKSIKLLSDESITIRLNVVPTKINQDSILGLADIAKKYRVKYLSASPLMTIGRGATEDLEPDVNKMFCLENKLANRLERSGVIFEGGISGAICKMYKYRDDIKKFYPEREAPKTRICDAGTRKMFIDAIGNCYPCSLFAMDKRFCIGNISEESVSRIWHSRKLNIFKKGIPIDKDVCSECSLLSICGGGCMALSVKHFNNIYKHDPRCTNTDYKEMR